MADEKAIIIIKKKGGHGGHHGGAWKVAYADFVTAMMAFFMVMWLVNSAETEQRDAIASYFRKPGLFASGSGTPLLIGGAGILPDAYAPNLATVERKFVSGMTQTPMTKRTGDEDAIKAAQIKAKGETGKGVIIDGKTDSTGFGLKETTQKGNGKGKSPSGQSLEKLKQDIANEIKKQLAGMPELSKLLGSVDVKIEADGLNIEIMDSDKQSMFEIASSTINPLAKAAFFKIAEALKSVPNQIDIVGHTDAKPFGRGFKGYTNWELSADRANSARRLLQEAGIPQERITSVLGKADRELKVPELPESEKNRRITLKVRFPKNVELLGPDLIQQTLESEPEPEEPAPEEVHSFTPEQILKKQKVKAESTVSLEEVINTKTETESAGSEKTVSQDSSIGVFDDFPVIADGMPFGSR